MTEIKNPIYQKTQIENKLKMFTKLKNFNHSQHVLIENLAQKTAKKVH